MRIVSYDGSRVTCLFPLEEVIPLSGVNDREIIDAVAAKYTFLKSPDPAKDNISKEGYKFFSGQFSYGTTIFRVNDFSIYQDGLVVKAATTNGSEAFLDDVIAYMQSRFGFRDFETAPRRYFQSQLVVEFERSPERLVKHLDKMTEAISIPLEKIFGMKIPMKFARLDLDFDKTSKPNPSPSVVQRFIIERRAGIPFERERYFCAAPMRTADHEHLLAEIESFID
ncbi:MAG TPA: hypothetical protein VIJ04_02335 [Xanthobacteraceae bacterium]